MKAYSVEIVGSVVAALLSIVIGLLWVGIRKVQDVCKSVVGLQLGMTSKTDEKEYIAEHKKIEVELGKIGTRVLKLELAVKVIQKEDRE